MIRIHFNLKNSMKENKRHIGWWLCSMILLLCVACGKEDGGGDEPTPTPQPTPVTPGVKTNAQLEIYVYTPERPIVTRAGEVTIEPEANEKAIHTLNIWVFVAEDKTVGGVTLNKGKWVGHISQQISGDFNGGSYKMTVSEDFLTVMPKVDVYVTANVQPGNTGVSLSADSEQADIEGGLLTGRYFGFSASMVTSVPEEVLPMSGVLKDAAVTGSAPVLTVQTKVKVVRAVSKVRFVFSRTEVQNLSIVGISLGGNIIPKAEYLFLEGDWSTYKSHIDVTQGYEAEETSLAPLKNAGRIPVSSEPSQYAYTGELQGDAYEQLINDSINDGFLGEVGRFYLRETDRKLSGKIKYRIADGEEKTALFSMSGSGNFTRNHTWIVYGYFAGKENLQISSVTVNPWEESPSDHPVYNW